MAINEIDLKGLRLLHEVASQAPWRVVDYNQENPHRDTWLGIVQGAVEILAETFQIARVKYSALPKEENVANANLIVAARNKLPELLDEIEALKKQLSSERVLREDVLARACAAHAKLCFPVSDKNISEARELLQPLFQDLRCMLTPPR